MERSTGTTAASAATHRSILRGIPARAADIMVMNIGNDSKSRRPMQPPATQIANAHSNTLPDTVGGHSIGSNRPSGTRTSVPLQLLTAARGDPYELAETVAATQSHSAACGQAGRAEARGADEHAATQDLAHI